MTVDERIAKLENDLDVARDELRADINAALKRLEVLERRDALERVATSLEALAYALCGSDEFNSEHNVAEQLARLADALEPIAKKIARDG